MFIALGICCLSPSLALAQEPAEGEETQPQTEQQSLTEGEGSKIEESEDGEAERIDEIEKRLADMEARETENRQELEEVKLQLEAQEEEKLEATMEEDTVPTGDKLLQIYGFFDVKFIKYFMEDDSVFHTIVGDKSSFAVTNLNLYFLSQMTENFSALAELRFTFLPHAERTDVQVLGDDDSSSDYVNTTTVDPFTSERYPLGGMAIERVHLTWSPVDWFNVLAGRYLTPYGIWNIDHGSPVVLPVRVPYMQLRSAVPNAQTGLQVFGRFFPSSTLFLDYAVTLSNGSDDDVTLRDLNEEKAVGLKLKLTYESKDLTISLGGYGLYNKQASESIYVANIFPGGGLDPDDPNVVSVVTEETGKRREYIVTTDLQIKFSGILLQSEFLWYMLLYEGEHPSFNEAEVLLKGGTGFEEWYKPSHTGQSWYGLLAYTLPIEELIGGVRVTPYYMLELYPIDSSTPSENYTLHNAGINTAFNAYVVLKLEWSLIIPQEKKIFGGNLKSLTAQLAVAF